MHIAIDMTGLMPLPTGVDVYMRQLVLNLAKIDQDNRYTLLLARDNRKLFANRLPGNFRVQAIGWRSRPARAVFQQCLLPGLARQQRFDVLHSPAFLLPLASKAPRHLLSVHDMTFFQMPQMHTPLRSSAPFLWAVRRSIQRADLICVPSRATEAALLRQMPGLKPSRIRVVPHGIEDRFHAEGRAPFGEVPERLGLAHPYILFVGTLEPRKNLPALVRAYRKLIASGDVAEHLVLAGKPGWGIEDLERELQSPDLRGRVHRIGYAPNDDLPQLYRGASLFVYPSLYEGFGFPPLEAMACGVPVIAARNSSLDENLGGAAELIEAGDADTLAQAMCRILKSRALQEQLQSKGLARAAEFRWNATATAMIEAYQQLGGSNRSS